MITDEISIFLDTQKLGYVATVSSDCKPNVSPKGTIARWDYKTLIFANIRSPDTIANLEQNPNVEISVIDPLIRRGYLFEGTASIINAGNVFDNVLEFYRKRGVQSPISSIVLVNISTITKVTSPLYDMGISENEIKSKWQKEFLQR